MVSTNLILFTVFLASASAAPSTIDDNFKLEEPVECKGKDICMVKPKNYEKIENRIRELLHIFTNTEVQERKGEPCPYISDEKDWLNCPYHCESGEPFLMNSTDGKRNIIAQIDNFKQTVLTRKCAREQIDMIKTSNQECYQGSIIDESVFSTSCEKVTAFRYLYVYEKNKIKLKEFNVPVYCSCKVTRE